MIGRRIIVLAACVGSLSVLAHGQTATQQAKTEGKAFGGVLAPSSLNAARTTPNAASLPNFTATPGEVTYYGSPSSLEPAARAAAPGSVGYQAVTESLANRATFPASEISNTVTVGKVVAADPYPLVSGYANGGGLGTCVPIPGGGAPPGYYEQTCNAGFTQPPGGGPQTCSVTLDHSFSTAYRYECSDFDAAGNRTDDCTLYEPYAGTCERTGMRPGRCLQMGQYGCVEPGEPIALLTCSVLVPGGELLGSTNQYNGSMPNDGACSAQKADPSCTPEPDVCTDSTPVTRVISGVAVTQPCWAWTRTYQCVPPVVPASDCGELDALGCTFLREQCITEEFPCLTVDRVYSCPLPPVPTVDQQICDADVYCLNGECDTLDRQPNAEFKDALVALNAVSQAGKEFDPNTLTIFDGDRLTCSKTIFGTTNCCVPRGFPLLGGCDAQDRVLKQRREEGLCAFVGTYCSSKVLGICLKKREAHCCFVSKISRILQEQGRPQINKPWDDPKNEQCRGFTIAEFQRLDLSVMDFSEVYADFAEAAQIPADLDVVNEMQAKINAYYAANPG